MNREATLSSIRQSIRRAISGLFAGGNAQMHAELTAMRAALAKEYKWRRRLEQKVDALLRDRYLEAPDFISPGSALLARRFPLTSQNEEDGIVLHLTRAMGPRSRRFVDIGCGRNGGNCGVLAGELGWSGLFVDASTTAIRQVADTFRANPGVVAERTLVSPEGINGLLTRHSVEGEVDVFSLDIDSLDYWVLEAMSACQPRLLIVEYNYLFGPSDAVTVPRDYTPATAPKGYHGASLSAFHSLLTARGYRLVICDPSGVNAFFLRDGECPDIPGLEPRTAFVAQANRKTPKQRVKDSQASDDWALTKVG